MPLVPSDQTPVRLSPPRAPQAMMKQAARGEPILGSNRTLNPDRLALEDAFEKNQWVNRSVRLIAGTAGSIPLRVVNVETEEEDTSPKARELLRLIEHPNSTMAGNDFIERVVTGMLVRQSLVWMQWDQLERTPAMPKTPPKNLVLLPAHATTGEIRDGRIAFWKVRGADGGLSIPAWQVIQMGFYNPRDPARSLSPTSVVFQSADTNYAIQIHNANFFERGARMSGLIFVKGEPGEPQVAYAQSLLESLTGLGNEHQIGVLPFDGDFKSFMANMKDMDFQKLGEVCRDEIGGGMGTGRFLMGTPEGTNRATAREARRAFWMETVLPIIRDVFDKLNVLLVQPFFAPNLRLEADLSKVEALAEDRTEFSDAFQKFSSGLEKIVGKVITEEEARAELRMRFGMELAEGVPDFDLSQNEPEPESEDEPEAQPETDTRTGMGLRVLRRLSNEALARMKAGKPALSENRVKLVLARAGVPEPAAARLAERFVKDTAGKTPSEVFSYFAGMEQQLKQKAAHA